MKDYLFLSHRLNNILQYSGYNGHNQGKTIPFAAKEKGEICIRQKEAKKRFSLQIIFISSAASNFSQNDMAINWTIFFIILSQTADLGHCSSWSFLGFLWISRSTVK